MLPACNLLVDCSIVVQQMPLVSQQQCCASSSDVHHCIAGHEEVAEFLLQRGAVCNPYTFDGDRCHCELMWRRQLHWYRLALLGWGLTP